MHLKLRTTQLYLRAPHQSTKRKRLILPINKRLCTSVSIYPIKVPFSEVHRRALHRRHFAATARPMNTDNFRSETPTQFDLARWLYLRIESLDGTPIATRDDALALMGECLAIIRPPSTKAASNRPAKLNADDEY